MVRNRPSPILGEKDALHSRQEAPAPKTLHSRSVPTPKTLLKERSTSREYSTYPILGSTRFSTSTRRDREDGKGACRRMYSRSGSSRRVGQRRDVAWFGAGAPLR